MDIEQFGAWEASVDIDEMGADRAHAQLMAGRV